jgi:hypothetical protein
MCVCVFFVGACFGTCVAFSIPLLPALAQAGRAGEGSRLLVKSIPRTAASASTKAAICRYSWKASTGLCEGLRRHAGVRRLSSGAHLPDQRGSRGPTQKLPPGRTTQSLTVVHQRRFSLNLICLAFARLNSQAKSASHYLVGCERSAGAFLRRTLGHVVATHSGTQADLGVR